MNAMDPELMRLAQEQMSRMSPSDFAKMQQQMMANPELIRMATEGMKNLRAEDLKNAMEQMKHTRLEEMAEIGEKMANSTPEEIATMRTRLDAKIAYELNGAQMLKKQGNELHSQGKYNDASQKYLLAKNNLKAIPSSKGQALRLACSLNLMSCYLKTKQYNECIKEGSEVLASDLKNVKALYRRGQAYKELGQFRDAVHDLRKAHEVSPDDETISDVLRDAQDRLAEMGDEPASRGLVIEEIDEDEATVASCNSTGSSSVTQSREIGDSNKTERVTRNGASSSNSEHLQALKSDPEALRSLQNFIANSNPETLAALNPDNSGDISADMMKTASNMIGKMSPEELQRMLDMASSFQKDNPSSTGGLFGTNYDSFKSKSIPPNVTPDMLKTASDMMGKMSPDELLKMFEMASSLSGSRSMPTAGTTGGSSSETSSRFSGRASSVVSETNVGGESSSRSFVSSSSSSPSMPSFLSSTADMQEQMRNQMKDPAVRQMFTSMIKNMSPEMMANMSEQFGIKLSREDAEKAQQKMSSFSPEDLDRMMRWADRIQRGAEGVKKTKTWLLGKPGMILAICMLILAVILHRLGYIGA